MSGVAAHSGFVARETCVSIVINAAISAGFFVAFFGWGGTVTAAALAPDSFPQAFAIGLMGSLIPGLLTRSRVGRGAISARIGKARIGVVPRAILIAIGSGIALGGAAYLALKLVGGEFAWAAALPLKMACGGLVALVVTPLAVRAALLPHDNTGLIGETQ